MINHKHECLEKLVPEKGQESLNHQVQQGRLIDAQNGTLSPGE